MKTCLILCMLLSISIVHADEWYENGNLHNADLKKWKASDTSNKFATCGDFVANFYKHKTFRSDVQNAIKKTEDLKPYAAWCIMLVDSYADMFNINDKKLNTKVVDIFLAAASKQSWFKK